MSDAADRRALVATAAELGAVFAKRAERHDREASFPYDDFADLREAGFLALCVPAAWGGLGASFADYCRVSNELGRHAPATALAFNMHCVTMLLAGQIADDLTWTTDERAALDTRRQLLYEGVIDGGTLHSQPFSEGNAPGATEGIATLAEPVDGGYLVTGRKIFASLSEAANIHNIVAKVPGDERVRFLGVPAVAEGLSIVGEWDPLGMRATLSRTLVFDRVFVPNEQRVAAARRLRSGRDALAALLHDVVVHVSRLAARSARRDAVVPPAFGSCRPSDQAAGMGRAADPLRAGPSRATRGRRRGGRRSHAGAPSTGVGGGRHRDGRCGRDGVVGAARRAAAARC